MQRFCQGQFDAEFTEKVAHKGPDLSVQLFQFLNILQGNTKVPAPRSVPKFRAAVHGTASSGKL